jgi:hypothetical protein
MDEEIQKWQNMWQQKKSKGFNLDGLIKRLNKIEKKESFRRKMLIVALIVMLSAFLFKLEGFDSRYSIITFLFVAVGISMELILLYKVKYNFVNENILFDNKNYVKKLKSRLEIRAWHLLIIMTLLIIGLNFTLLGLYEKGDIFSYDFKREYRLPFHLSTVGLFMLAFFVNSRRLKNRQKESLELIKELEFVFEDESNV